MRFLPAAKKSCRAKSRATAANTYDIKKGKPLKSAEVSDSAKTQRNQDMAEKPGEINR